MVAQSVSEMIKKQVVLEVEGIDRLYLNGYVPMLQTEGGFVHFVHILHAVQFSVFENSWNFSVIKVCILLLKRVPRSRRQASMLSLKVANLS